MLLLFIFLNIFKCYTLNFSNIRKGFDNNTLTLANETIPLLMFSSSSLTQIKTKEAVVADEQCAWSLEGTRVCYLAGVLTTAAQVYADKHCALFDWKAIKISKGHLHSLSSQLDEIFIGDITNNNWQISNSPPLIR